MSEPDPLHSIHVVVCNLCIIGLGGECHTPGCMFWMDDAPSDQTATTLRFLAGLEVEP